MPAAVPTYLGSQIMKSQNTRFLMDHPQQLLPFYFFITSDWDRDVPQIRLYLTGWLRV